MTPMQDTATREEVAATVETVLARREFGGEDSMLDELARWLANRFELEGAFEAGDLAFTFIVALLAVVLVYGLVRFVIAGARRRDARPDDTSAASAPTPAERVRVLLDEARRARAHGDVRLALRQLFFALVLGLGERGDLQYHDAWTNRELLRRGRPSPEVGAILTPLVAELEAKEFGRDEVTETDLDRLEALCVRYLGSVAEAA